VCWFAANTASCASVSAIRLTFLEREGRETHRFRSGVNVHRRAQRSLRCFYLPTPLRLRIFTGVVAIDSLTFHDLEYYNKLYRTVKEVFITGTTRAEW